MNLLKFAIIATLITGFSTFGLGCAEEVEAPKPVVKAKPKPKPKAKTIDVLMTELSIDPRVYVDEEEAPRDELTRIAILKFFDSMLKVDASALKKVLAVVEDGEDGDQEELDAMMQRGLTSQMNSVSHVEVKIGSSPDGLVCLMAVYEIDMNYQVQVWYVTKSGDGFTFTSESTPPNLANLLRGDWITHFFELREEMIEIANQPDDDSSYTIFGSSSEDDSGSSGPRRPNPSPSPKPGGPSAPGGPLG